MVASASFAQDGRPFRCSELSEPLRGLPTRSGYEDFCRSIDAMVAQGDARRRGMPTPSASVVQLPRFQTGQARDGDAYCSEHRALVRLDGGWRQVYDQNGHWQRCEVPGGPPPPRITRSRS